MSVDNKTARVIRNCAGVLSALTDLSAPNADTVDRKFEDRAGWTPRERALYAAGMADAAQTLTDLADTMDNIIARKEARDGAV